MSGNPVGLQVVAESFRGLNLFISCTISLSWKDGVVVVVGGNLRFQEPTSADEAKAGGAIGSATLPLVSWKSSTAELSGSQTLCFLSL